MPAIGLASPLGPLRVVETGGAIATLDWSPSPDPEPTPLLEEAARQLEAYFDRRLEVFDLPLAPAGTSFQQRIFEAMRAIPFGETRTYGDLAKRTGSVARAVGQACGANPVAIVIPCHRVLAASGSGGFSALGGVETKIALLRHEGGGGYLL